MFDWELMSLSHLISPPKAQKSGRNPRFNKAKALNFEAFSESKPLIQTTKRKVGRESNPTQKGFLTHTDTKFKTTHTHTHTMRTQNRWRKLQSEKRLLKAMIRWIETLKDTQRRSV